MRAPIHNFLLLAVSFFLLATSSPSTSSFSLTIEFKFPKRRVLHQPLFPITSAPPPETVPPPPPESIPDEPFFPEVPPAAPTTTTATPPLPVSAVNGSVPIPAVTQPANPAKKVVIAISVRIVTLGMLSALTFFLYRHRVKTSGEGQKLYEGGEVSRRFDGEDSRAPPSSSPSPLGDRSR